MQGTSWCHYSFLVGNETEGAGKRIMCGRVYFFAIVPVFSKIRPASAAGKVFGDVHKFCHCMAKGVECIPFFSLDKIHASNSYIFMIRRDGMSMCL